jgi:cytochrome c5
MTPLSMSWRGAAPILLVALAGAACSARAASPIEDPPPASLLTLYLTDANARRAALVRSLVNPGNEYSQLRLTHYDTGNDDDWSLLPEANPRVEAVLASELDAAGGAVVGGPLGDGAASLAILPDAQAGDLTALIALGEDAFFHYPVQASLAVESATGDEATFTEYGFWVDATYGAGGLVREETPDGGSVLSFTCATCHAAPRDGGLVVGVGNDRLDIGRLTIDASAGASPTIAKNFLAWGRGRLDVTTVDGTEPVRIADVRPVSWLGFLHADATIAMKDIVTLAIRIETLIITSHDDEDRPPREISLGLAAYVLSLSASLPTAAPSTAETRSGESVFQANCTGCHEPPSLTGTPVLLDVIGTNPTVGLSAVRGTGAYRVPSLHGVSARRALLHDASLPSLGAMFDPSRLDASYAGGRFGPGPVPGHVFGLDLDESSRANLVAYLLTL